MSDFWCVSHSTFSILLALHHRRSITVVVDYLHYWIVHLTLIAAINLRCDILCCFKWLRWFASRRYNILLFRHLIIGTFLLLLNVDSWSSSHDWLNISFLHLSISVKGLWLLVLGGFNLLIIAYLLTFFSSRQVNNLYCLRFVSFNCGGSRGLNWRRYSIVVWCCNFDFFLFIHIIRCLEVWIRLCTRFVSRNLYR